MKFVTVDQGPAFSLLSAWLAGQPASEPVHFTDALVASCRLCVSSHGKQLRDTPGRHKKQEPWSSFTTTRARATGVEQLGGLRSIHPPLTLPVPVPADAGRAPAVLPQPP